MIFDSIKGYFYKLYNICYVLVLMPLVLFLFLYYQAQVEKILPIIQDQSARLGTELTLFLLALFALTTVHLYLKRQLAEVSKEPGLGDKMGRYFSLAMWRTGVGSLTVFLMNIGFYLTGNIWFAVACAATVVWIGWLWPTPKRFCDDLSVRSDERDLMLRSKDSF
jgi:hypothetical protein